MPTDVSVIVVSYNTRELTLACLRSVHEQTTGVNVETICVDNCSSDSSADAIAKEFPQMRLLRLTENRGFAAANNIAAAQADGRFLLLLNPDTAVLNHAINKLLAFAQARPENGIYGGRTLFADGTLNPTSCWARSTPWTEFCHAFGLSALFRRNCLFDRESLGRWKRDTVRQVDIVTGCFLLIRRDLWQQLGGFDPAFFMYGEEADLCQRARKLGARPIICPGAVIIHYGGKSQSKRANKLVSLLKARRQLMERHWPKAWVGFGRAMQSIFVLTRLTAWWALAPVGKQTARQAADSFREVWRRRSEWVVRPRLYGRRQRVVGWALPTDSGDLRTRGVGGAHPTGSMRFKHRGEMAKRTMILAVASGGGHWVQLLRMRPAWEGHDVAYVTTDAGYRQQVAPARFYPVRDANRWDKIGLVRQALRLAWIVLRERPDVVVSTGAAPGCFAIRLAKLLGARTVWIDSIANVQELSLSGRLIGRHADLWLTQWEHLACEGGPLFRGTVL